MKKGFYITNSIPYVNAAPHIGHALEFVQSDAIKRYNELLGYETLLLCGADENALKNVQAAEKAGVPIQQFIDKNGELFLELANKLNVHFDIFQKGSNKETHFPASQKLWELCLKNGDIYKGKYEGLYCVGCETFYTRDELNENGECFEHPGRTLDTVAEDNYFFRLSKYQNQLIHIIEENEIKIYPEFRKKEVLSFLKKPLQDISISRSNERAKNWGVPVPNDDSQRMYVWFDALNIYQSGIGFGWDEQKYKAWWPADVQVIGKGIIRFHAVYWPAFLLSAGLTLPKSLFVHGYLTINGQKMSKTLGNVIDPIEIIEKYGTDALRYYFLREIPSTDDGDFSFARLQEVYDSDLANELGNLITRVTTIAAIDNLTVEPTKPTTIYTSEVKTLIENFQFHRALESIGRDIKGINKKVDAFAPWKKTKSERNQFLTATLQKLNHIGYQLIPFIPSTAEKIQKATSNKISKAEPLFPKK